MDDTYKTGRLLLGNDVIKMMMLMHIIQNFLVSTQILIFGLRTPLPVVAFWVYLPGQNDTHSRIAVLFPVHMVGFNRLGDPKKSPNGRGVLWGWCSFCCFSDWVL